jgi:hypothetical protein
MSKIKNILWTEPVVFLSIANGLAVLLAKEHFIASWIPLVVLVITTPIARAAVQPKQNG